MWPDEITWTITQLKRFLPSSVKTAIDVGSEGEEYRTRRQPWNQKFYDFLESSDITIYTMDIDPKTNADFIHDITKSTKDIGKFDIVFATHLLEHIQLDKFQNAIKNLEQMVSARGFLWVSVPNKYPYHARPIDNGWRPTCKELIKPFNGRPLCLATFNVNHTLPEYMNNPKNRMSCALLKY